MTSVSGGLPLGGLSARCRQTGRVAALVAVLALAGSRPGTALDPKTDLSQYTVDVWQDTGGLPQNFVKTILQTRDGYLWVGTKSGLARFDGLRFTVFDDRRPDQLAESEVWTLLEGDDGSLWVGTFGGGLSRYRDRRFTTYRKGDGLASDFVVTLARGRDGSIWVGTTDGLSRLKDGRFTSYTAQDGLLQNRVTALFAGNDGTLWIGSGKGLNALKGGRVASYPMGFQGDGRITAVAEDRDGSLWLGTTTDGVLRFAGGAVVGRHTTRQGLASDAVMALRLDGAGVLWMGTRGGLCRLQAGQTSCLQSTAGAVTDRTRQERLFVRDIEVLAEDQQGSLWLGTVADGIIRLKDTLFLNYGTEAGLPAAQTRAVLHASDGAIWAATVGGAARLRDGRTTTYRPRDGLSHEAAGTLFEDRDGSVWIGTAVGLNVVRDGRVQPIRDGPLKDAYINGLLRDRRGDLWVGTNDNGVLHQQGRGYVHYTKESGLGGNAVRHVLEDPQGAIWIATRDGGLTRWFDGRFTVFTTKDGLPRDSVQRLYLDRRGGLWVATRHGLSLMRDGRVVGSYTVEDGLPANFIYSLIEDEAGDLWLTCGRGIFRVPRGQWDALLGERRPLEPVGYGPDTGYRSGGSVPIGSGPTVARDARGRLWFAHQSGVSVIDPANPGPRPGRVPVWIEDLEVDGRAVALDARTAVPPPRGDLEIRYTGIDLAAPDRLRFRYRLEGFDPDWVEAGARRVAFYTRVPPGAYRFRVQALADGVWSDREAAVAFRLQPRFYQTTWFSALGVLAGVGFVAGVFRLRTRTLRRRQHELMRRVQEEVAKVRVLSGLLPICAWCKKIRDDTGYWSKLEEYIASRSHAEFTHGICPECVKGIREQPSVRPPGRDA
jgi:ligand-binding sensor domain-containing protein